MLSNGVYTISGPRGHETFRVKTQKQTSKFFGGKRLLEVRDSSAMFGWNAFGQVSDNGETVEVLRFRKTPTTDAFVGLFNLFARATDDEIELAGRRYTMQVVKHCRVCNRKLTHPESIVDGIGPECKGRGYRDARGTEKSVPA